MAFNTNSGQVADNINNEQNKTSETVSKTTNVDKTVLKATRSITTLFTHILIGIVTGVAVLFSFRQGVPMSKTSQHVLCCVVGYQMLMAEAILCLAPDSWLSALRLKHKLLIHWVLQILGSVLALAGNFIMILNKSTHWKSLHGQFALVSMVFTVASLANGLASLYAYEWRRVVPGILSKLSHILFGVVALSAASISLCYGFHKRSFRNWATSEFADAVIVMTAVLTSVVIINPFITFFSKFFSAVKK